MPPKALKVLIPAELHLELKLYATERQQQMKDIVTEALQRFLQKRKSRRTRS